MDIAIDAGNSRTKVGVFEAGRLLEKRAFPNHSPEEIIAYCRIWQPADVIVSASGQFPIQVGDLKVSGRVYTFTPDTRLPFQNLYETPETLGHDRVACVAGAWLLFPGQASLVIDAGTCITYDFIDRGGRYSGGNIAPGLRMRLKAMHAYTSALPDVSDHDPGEVMADTGFMDRMGKSTQGALMLGGYLGALYEMEGYIAAFQADNQEINIILTGGDAVFFDEQLKTKIFVLPDLVLTGLAGILQYQKNAYV